MKQKRDKYLKKKLKYHEKDNSSKHLSQYDELISDESSRPGRSKDKEIVQEAANTLKTISSNFISSLQYKKVWQILHNNFLINNVGSRLWNWDLSNADVG